MMVFAEYVPTPVAWPILSALVLVGMVGGTIAGEVISAYRTWENKRKGG